MSNRLKEKRKKASCTVKLILALPFKFPDLENYCYFVSHTDTEQVESQQMQA